MRYEQRSKNLRTHPSQGLNLEQTAKKEHAETQHARDKNYKLAKAANKANWTAPAHPPRTCMLRES